jgi:hypothetical protein
MNRRNFVASSLSIAAAGGLTSSTQAQGQNERPFYELILYQCQNGEPLKRLESWLKDSLIPAMNETKKNPFGCFSLAVGVETPQLMIIIEHASSAAIPKFWAEIQTRTGWKKGLEKLEEGRVPPYHRIERSLLQATEYSPPLSEVVGKSERPRLFEFRIYHSPTFRQLTALHERFAGPEIKIFHRSGIYPIMYADTVYGAKMPCLTYMMPFESLAAREVAWNKFRNDPEWHRVRDESVKNFGEIVSNLDRLIFNATSYSPIK